MVQKLEIFCFFFYFWGDYFWKYYYNQAINLCLHIQYIQSLPTLCVWDNNNDILHFVGVVDLHNIDNKIHLLVLTVTKIIWRAIYEQYV